MRFDGLTTVLIVIFVVTAGVITVVVIFLFKITEVTESVAILLISGAIDSNCRIKVTEPSSFTVAVSLDRFKFKKSSLIVVISVFFFVFKAEASPISFT